MVRLRISISRFCRCICNILVHTFVLQRTHPAATELISAHDNGDKMTSIPVTCYRREVDGRSGGVDGGYVVLISLMRFGAMFQIDRTYNAV